MDGCPKDKLQCLHREQSSHHLTFYAVITSLASLVEGADLVPAAALVRADFLVGTWDLDPGYIRIWMTLEYNLHYSVTSYVSDSSSLDSSWPLGFLVDFCPKDRIDTENSPICTRIIYLQDVAVIRGVTHERVHTITY